MTLPGAGAPPRLYGVTFLHIPTDEMNVNMKLILSIFGSLNTPDFLSNADLQHHPAFAIGASAFNSAFYVHLLKNGVCFTGNLFTPATVVIFVLLLPLSLELQ